MWKLTWNNCGTSIRLSLCTRKLDYLIGLFLLEFPTKFLGSLQSWLRTKTHSFSFTCWCKLGAYQQCQLWTRLLHAANDKTYLRNFIGVNLGTISVNRKQAENWTLEDTALQCVHGDKDYFNLMYCDFSCIFRPTVQYFNYWVIIYSH